MPTAAQNIGLSINTMMDDEIIKSFELINLHELDTEQILHSEIPEEIILAILGEYPREKAGATIKRILERLRALCGDDIRLHKYIQQLIDSTMTIEKIAHFTKVSVEYVLNIKEQLKK